MSLTVKDLDDFTLSELDGFTLHELDTMTYEELVAAVKTKAHAVEQSCDVDCVLSNKQSDVIINIINICPNAAPKQNAVWQEIRAGVATGVILSFINQCGEYLSEHHEEIIELLKRAYELLSDLIK